MFLCDIEKTRWDYISWSFSERHAKSILLNGSNKWV